MGLFSRSAKSRSGGPARSYPKPFAGWEAPSAFTTVADSMGLQVELEALFTEHNLDDINGAEFSDWAYLVHERDNPDGYVTVCIWVQGYFIGRLDQAMTGKYIVGMNGLNSQGLNLMMSVHLQAQRAKTCLANRVTLSLPLVGAVGPVNFFPRRAFTISPPGSEIVLEDSENYVEPLRPSISTGKTTLMALVMIEEQSDLHAYLDRKTYVGRVPDMQAELIIPLVRAIVPRKLIPVARGLLTDSNIHNSLSIVTGNTRTTGTSWVPIHDDGHQAIISESLGIPTNAGKFR